MQSQIDDALRRQFEASVPTEHTIAEWMREVRSDDPAPVDTARAVSTRDRRTWIALTVAVAIAGVIITWQLANRRQREPFFEPRPLAEIYRETLAHGFKPYYECHDQERFAFTFATRQGQPLQLAQLPADRRMLGLSYSGGLSRDTTAMLCRVQGQPVIVFVDRLEADQVLAVQNSGPDLHVLRKEYHGLVFYEVTPFAESQMMDYLVVPTADVPNSF